LLKGLTSGIAHGGAPSYVAQRSESMTTVATSPQP
jgi:hypothetical protein